MKVLVRVMKWALALVVLLGCGVFALLLWLDRPLPDGVRGARADREATDLMRRLGCDAWRNVKAVQWTFRGQRSYLWDRDRGYVRVRNGDLTVSLDIARRDGRAWRSREPLAGAQLKQALEKAYAWFINDAFWLNPFCTLDDDGVVKAWVQSADETGLLVEYTQGGVTPGDSYLIVMDDRGIPKAWRMWVSILPVDGLRTSFEGWHESRGCMLARDHRLGPISIEIDAQLADDVRQFNDGVDPFAGL